jgi:hypothetical protein
LTLLVAAHRLKGEAIRLTREVAWFRARASLPLAAAWFEVIVDDETARDVVRISRGIVCRIVV